MNTEELKAELLQRGFSEADLEGKNYQALRKLYRETEAQSTEQAAATEAQSTEQPPQSTEHDPEPAPDTPDPELEPAPPAAEEPAPGEDDEEEFDPDGPGHTMQALIGFGGVVRDSARLGERLLAAGDELRVGEGKRFQAGPKTRAWLLASRVARDA